MTQDEIVWRKQWRKSQQCNLSIGQRRLAGTQKDIESPQTHPYFNVSNFMMSLQLNPFNPFSFVRLRLYSNKTILRGASCKSLRVLQNCTFTIIVMSSAYPTVFITLFSIVSQSMYYGDITPLCGGYSYALTSFVRGDNS